MAWLIILWWWCSCQGTATSPSATCNDYAVMDAGSIPSAVFGEAMSRMDAAISKMQIDNEKTHKTPAFVYEVLLAVVEALRTGGAGSVKSARGGTADVGRHTGSERRDTSWALVQQTFRVSRLRILHWLCCIVARIIHKCVMAVFPDCFLFMCYPVLFYEILCSRGFVLQSGCCCWGTPLFWMFV